MVERKVGIVLDQGGDKSQKEESIGIFKIKYLLIIYIHYQCISFSKEYFGLDAQFHLAYNIYIYQ